MLPLLTSDQIHQADKYTIEHEPISSVNLMERASKAFVGWFVNRFADRSRSISIYCGTGNNGGDGLAIARILYDHQYKNINVRITRFSDKSTDDFNTNLERLPKSITSTEIKKGDELPVENSDIIIDAMLGSGINKPLAGDYERLVKHLNELHKTVVVAVDVPTGFFTEGEIAPDATALKTELVITFQQPKINFLLPEAGPYIKCWEAVNIGIDEKFICSLDSSYQFVQEKDIRKMLRLRHRFSNKGSYGHALIVAGQAKTMGAALLSASACALAGCGLTTACVPDSGLVALNSYMAEIMAVIRQGNDMPEISWDKFSTMGIGPGLGDDENTLALLTYIFTNYKKPMVIDADALNVISVHKQLWQIIPEGSVLTPHMKEFDRLFGEHANWWQRLQTAINKAKELKLCIILKNDYTITATPEGKAYFNSTSNQAMASGGMGDVLTGVVTALLAQNYTSEEACIIGNYIHGKAGDELALPNRMNVVLPSKLAAQLPVTMAKLMA
jgi:NAD(P)H-hydrate epimerase